MTHWTDFIRVARWARTTRSRCAGWVVLAGWLTTQGAWAQNMWVHGSWVHLRTAPAANAPTRQQLTTNTPLQMTGRDGDWCAVRVSTPAAQGYVHCSLLGPDPLTLAQTANQPGRAFWVAPSVGRLMAYGALLRTGPQYQRMYEQLKAGDTARVASSPEFEAAKRLMATGVVPKWDQERQRPGPIAAVAMPYARLISPKPIKPSLFTSQSEVLTTAEANVDRLAAVARSVVSVQVTAAPTAYVNRHEGPEISGISGFGDVGDIDVHFNPPVLVYALLPNGLVGASVWSQHTIAGTPEYGAYCGQTYSDGGIGSPLSDGPQPLRTQPVAGYPKIPQGTLLMAQWVSTQPLTRKRLSIQSRAARVDLTTLVNGDLARKERVLSAQPTVQSAKVVLHEVDMDGDGVADMLVWDLPGLGDISDGLTLNRAWYLNINGQWYEAGAMNDQECT